MISSVSVYPPGNRVVVATPKDEPELRSLLRDRYGEAVTFKIEPLGQDLG
jgi:hypothetical protein